MNCKIRRLCALMLALALAPALSGCGKGDPTVANIRRGAKLLYQVTHQPPVSGTGILNGDEASGAEIWAGIRRFFGK